MQPNSATYLDERDDRVEKVKFTVDSALLRELGERLVGKPHIALAELVKNSYDADATKVEIRFKADSIEVVDNGHGMSFTEFEKFWMRVGSQHKQKQRFSREFNRPFTGSHPYPGYLICSAWREAGKPTALSIASRLPAVMVIPGRWTSPAISTKVIFSRIPTSRPVTGWSSPSVTYSMRWCR